MFFLKKVVTYFLLLPPGNAILILTLLSLYLLKKKLRAAGLTLLLTAAVLYLLSTEAVARTLIKPLEDRYSPPPREELLSCGALVVLGGGVKPGAPFLELKNDLYEGAFKRATAAVKLYLQRPRPVVVSGYSVSDRVSEAKVLKDYLVYMGVDPSLVYAEGKSRDTHENALFVKEVLKKLGVRNFCLITSAYHMERALLLFRKVGLDKERVVPVPVDYKASRSPLTVYKFLPTAYWLRVSSLALKEYFGLLFYSLF
ncbi:MAG: YdcF family protein [Aquificae bacterium]|nr:YdcF family protein [Aquificota bacterium]